MKNLKPNTCDECKVIMGSSDGNLPLTLFHGKWFCPDCLDKARKVNSGFKKG